MSCCGSIGAIPWEAKQCCNPYSFWYGLTWIKATWGCWYCYSVMGLCLEGNRSVDANFTWWTTRGGSTCFSLSIWEAGLVRALEGPWWWVRQCSLWDRHFLLRTDSLNFDGAEVICKNKDCYQKFSDVKYLVNWVLVSGVDKESEGIGFYIYAVACVSYTYEVIKWSNEVLKCEWWARI